jgi:hypothetical protein
LPDAFTNNKKIVKSYILAANTPAKIEVPVGQSINTVTNESKACLKRGRPIGAKDKILGRENHKEMKLMLLKRPYPQNRQIRLIHPNFLYKILLKINPPKKNFLKRNLLKSYPLKRNRYLKIMRSQ